MSSNIGQNYPYTSETEEQREIAVARAVEQFSGLRERIGAEADPLPPLPTPEPGQPHRWWVFVCPTDIDGRLHVAGYAIEKHALYTVCDKCGQSFLR